MTRVSQLHISHSSPIEALETVALQLHIPATNPHSPATTLSLECITYLRNKFCVIYCTTNLFWIKKTIVYRQILISHVLWVGLVWTVVNTVAIHVLFVYGKYSLIRHYRHVPLHA